MQGFLFLVAGYETTSTTLTYCTHLLATNPSKMTLLQNDIDQTILANVSNLNYKSINHRV